MFTIKQADKEMCSCRNCDKGLDNTDLYEISVTKGNVTSSFGVFCSVIVLKNLDCKFDNFKELHVLND